jgi:hypothetical protein
MGNGRTRLDRQTSPEVGDSVVELTEPEAAKAAVEVGPILGPQVECTPECLAASSICPIRSL